MLNFILSFIVSTLVILLLVRYRHLHEHLSADQAPSSGAQKIHQQSVPRIGGIGIFVSLVVATSQLYFNDPNLALGILSIVACGLPAFLSGLAEDLTKRVTPLARLLCTLAAALLAYLLLGLHVTRTGLVLLDAMIAYPAIGCCFTLLVIAGLANAINSIDGIHGLASMITFMMSASLAYVAYQVSDTTILSAALIMMGAIFGFFVWNFPTGQIFLGDGGAYFIGFMLGELSILLVMQHPEVSAWYPVLMLLYPTFEVLFSIYRRRFLHHTSIITADARHLHTLIYKRLIRPTASVHSVRTFTRCNALTAPYLWLLYLIAVIPATLFWRHTPLLVCFVAVFIAAYIWLYTCIVRFKVPRWLLFWRNNACQAKIQAE
ncbi:glycosyltransferase [Mycoavidus sp. B2-EB]|uniref:MraY family glycosyltransferase n=1 Tax=Mycoavidus sp. B2-EB TaxID=2651972 RepID=UPI0016277F87|nr:glycosyltransferase [Mycoavidus sp. B2-EB]BBO60038.1 glycosyl transferase [Mycoavidus sp. B2-EB]